CAWSSTCRKNSTKLNSRLSSCLSGRETWADLASWAEAELKARELSIFLFGIICFQCSIELMFAIRAQLIDPLPWLGSKLHSSNICSEATECRLVVCENDWRKIRSCAQARRN